MRRITLWVALGILAAAAVGLAGFVIIGRSLGSVAAQDQASQDPRQAPTLIMVALARPSGTAERAFTGVLSAKIQSDLAFRVAGKITARLVDVGQQVRRGDPLARLDDRDLALALVARRNAVASARATVVQAAAEEVRYRQLLVQGWVSRQKYEATQASLETARAALAASEAQAAVAGNEAAYAVLQADADGVVTQILAEPGAVVAAGQPVVRLAQAGPREAVVNLPEGFRPALWTQAEAIVYAASTGSEASSPARLRQLSDAADPASRTYEARFVLEGDAARAPLGSTVTLRIPSADAAGTAIIPMGALRDTGRDTGVWVLDADVMAVRFRPIRMRRLGTEEVVVEGIAPGERIAALGAHLLRDGQRVRVGPQEAAR